MPDTQTVDTESMERSLVEIMLKRLKITKDYHAIETQIEELYNKRLLETGKLSSLEKEMAEKLAEQKKYQDLISLAEEKLKTKIINKTDFQREYTNLSSQELKLIQEQIDIQKRINEEIEKRKTVEDYIYNLGKIGLSNVSYTLQKIIELRKNYSYIELSLLAWVSLLKNAYRVFDSMDQAAAEFRLKMGMTRLESQGVEKTAREISFELMHAGVSVDKVYDSIHSIAQSLGFSLFVTKEFASTLSLVSAQLGISASTSAEFLKTMSMVGKSTMESQKYLLAFAQTMSAAAQIPLGEVMDDIVNASKSAYQFLSRNPLVLSKAAIEARRLGTSLQSATSSAKDLIEFTSSVQSEMEASVLVGKALNLQKARELAYARDIEGLNKEILRLAKEANFEQLDPFQQEAVAKALGKSTYEIQQMITAERQWNRMLLSATEEQKKSLKLYDEMLKATRERAKAEENSVEYQEKMRKNLAYTTSISNAWRAIMQRLAEKFLPAIAWTLDTVNTILAKMNNSWVAIVGVVGSSLFLLKGVASVIGWIAGSLGTGLGKATAGFFGGLSTGLKSLALIPWSSIAKGAAVLLALGVSMIPLSISLKQLQGISWNTLAVATTALVGLTSALLGLGFLFMSPAGAALGAGIIALVGMSAGLIVAAYGFHKLGQALGELSYGLKGVVDSLARLQEMSFSSLTFQIISLSSAIKELSNILLKIPEIDIDKIETLGSVNILGKEKTEPIKTVVSDKNEQIILELQSLRKALESGAIRVVLRIGAAEFSSAIGRELSRTGTYEPTGRLPI